MYHVMRSSTQRQPRQTLPPPDAGSGGFITLDQIRPHPRVQNDYIDSPPRPKPPGNLKTISSGGTGNTVSILLRENQNNRTRGLRSLNNQIIRVPPVSNVSPPLKKDPVVVEEDNSIICKKCHKCRCGACTEPQDLPSKWLCGNKCHISADRAVETCSCYCCVQAVFYHCGKDDQDADYVCSSDPCACCSQPNCVKRWTCMALMALCLPCLCCYWPMKGALKCCTMCYNKCRKKGCQCSKTTKTNKKIQQNGSQSSRRLLLIESDSSSA